MKTISQQIIEAHKDYLTKQSLVKVQSKEQDNVLQSYSKWHDSNALRKKLIGIDPSFDIEGISYDVEFNNWNPKPAEFTYSNALAYKGIDIRNISKEEAIEQVNTYYHTEEIAKGVIQTNQEPINKMLSEVDNARRMKDMYQEMYDTNMCTFQDKVRSLMSRWDELIQFPSTRRFEEVDGNSYATNWTPQTKWVKYRFEDEKTWSDACAYGYEIIGKVKNNYLMNLHTRREGVIQDALVTPKQFGEMVSHAIYTLSQIEDYNDTVGAWEIREMTNYLLDDYNIPINKLADDINQLMGIYSSFRVIFHEGDHPDHKFELHEYNSEDQSWTHIKTFFFEDYIQTKQAV